MLKYSYIKIIGGAGGGNATERKQMFKLRKHWQILPEQATKIELKLSKEQGLLRGSSELCYQIMLQTL